MEIFKNYSLYSFPIYSITKYIDISLFIIYSQYNRFSHLAIEFWHSKIQVAKRKLKIGNKTQF